MVRREFQIGKQHGFILWWREIRETSLWSGPPLDYKLFSYLVMEANWKPKLWWDALGQCERRIERGQLVTSVRKLAVIIRSDYQTVRRSLNRLVRRGAVRRESTHRYTIITIVHYDDYSPLANATGSPQPSPPHSPPPSPPHLNHKPIERKKDKSQRFAAFQPEPPNDALRSDKPGNIHYCASKEAVYLQILGREELIASSNPVALVNEFVRIGYHKHRAWGAIVQSRPRTNPCAYLLTLLTTPRFPVSDSAMAQARTEMEAADEL